MDDEGYQVPQAENAIEERELENIKLDVRNVLIKATLPFKEELSNPHKDPEKVDPKYFKVRTLSGRKVAQFSRFWSCRRIPSY
jgi:hypothetical protein